MKSLNEIPSYQKLSYFTPTSVSDGLFYGNKPLTEYHIKKLNDNKEDYYIYLPDKGILEDIEEILYKELTRVGFIVNNAMYKDRHIDDYESDIIFADTNTEVETNNAFTIYFGFINYLLEKDTSKHIKELK